MDIIAFLVVGLIAGWIASSLVEGQGLGPLGDIVVGVIGAVLGGFIFNVFGIDAYGFWGSLVMSVIGAAVFLFIIRLFSGSHRWRRPMNKL